MYIKDLSDFKQRIFRQNDAKNRNLSRNKKCRFYDCSGSQTAVQNHEAQIADFESGINEKNKYKPIMLSCLTMSCIPTIHTQLQVLYTPHEEESNLRPFMKF